MRLMLAPMEGLVDAPIREILTQVGGIDRCVTEFIRVTHNPLPPRIFYQYAPELHHQCRTGSGVPVAVQLLGSDVPQMAWHAALAVELGAGQIDVNFGCPAKSVNRHQGGSILLRQPDLMHRIVAAIRAALPPAIPVTAKMRLGYEDRSMAVACGQALDAAGAAEIVIHARSKADGYKPPAYWKDIARVRESVATQVIANGEVWTVADYWRCREVSGCADVMIGRGLIARPDLALQIKASQRGQEIAPMCWAQVIPLMRRYGDSLALNLTDNCVCGRLKQWLNFLRRGFSEAESIWPAAKQINHLQNFYLLLDQSTV